MSGAKAVMALRRYGAVLRTDRFIVPALYLLAGGIAYLAFLPPLGYFTDAWYLMYAAGARGPLVFTDIFSVDRPLAAAVMIPAHWLLGSDPLLYGLAAFALRLLSALGLFWCARLLWPAQRSAAAMMGLSFLLYPGFLSQLNGIVYLPFLTSLAAAMFSVVCTIWAIQSSRTSAKFLFFLASAGLLLLYLGIVEFFVGVEVVRLLLIAVLVFRTTGSVGRRLMLTLRAWLPWLLPLAPYLAWRLFIFESQRGATDVAMHFRLADVLSSPLTFLAAWTATLWNDTSDVLLCAWFTPLSRLGQALGPAD
jgi:hypothetical protein